MLGTMRMNTTGNDSANNETPTIRDDARTTREIPMGERKTESMQDPLARVVGTMDLRPRDYALQHTIGSGGMARVVRATDRNMDRSVAMKILLDPHRASSSKLHRFIREARILGQLEHPNIVPIHELGIDDEGRLYYTMKLVKGVNLREILEKIGRGDAEMIGRYPLPALLTVYAKLCDAVAYAHSKGIIHRDLKPENVMVGDYGEVLLMDWGLAKPMPSSGMEAGDADVFDETGTVATASGSPALTMQGTVMGTPHFMAPEQAEGRIDQIDERTDIFALGGILYNILTLQPPFTGDTTEEVVSKAKAGHITPPTEWNLPVNQAASDQDNGIGRRRSMPHCPEGAIPDALAAVAMKALAREPAGRYASVPLLAEDIAAYMGGFATSVEERSPVRLLWLLIKRRKTEFFLGAGAFLALVVVGVFSMTQIIASEKRANENFERLKLAMAELRQTAPSFAAEARTLMERQSFEHALMKVEYAIQLEPAEAQYHLLKGNILQTLLRMREATQAYSVALELNVSLQEARDNIQACAKFIAENAGRDQWLPSSLNDLHAAMLRQQRTSEALAIMRQFGPDQGVLYDQWKSILERADIKVSSRTLQVNGRGLITLNLQNTSVDDVSALRDMPLERLTLAGTKVSDLTPLTGIELVHVDVDRTRVADIEAFYCMPLESLSLRDTRVRDITPLTGAPLQRLLLDSTPVSSLAPVREAPLKVLSLRGTTIEDLSALAAMPLEELNLEDTPVSDLSPLRKLPLKRLSLSGCEKIRDLNQLASCKTLEILIVPPQLENHPVMKQLPSLKVVTARGIGSGNWPKLPPAPPVK
jgi:serine/threonine protein kinase